MSENTTPETVDTVDAEAEARIAAAARAVTIAKAQADGWTLYSDALYNEIDMPKRGEPFTPEQVSIVQERLDAYFKAEVLAHDVKLSTGVKGLGRSVKAVIADVVHAVDIDAPSKSGYRSLRVYLDAVIGDSLKSWPKPQADALAKMLLSTGELVGTDIAYLTGRSAASVSRSKNSKGTPVVASTATSRLVKQLEGMRGKINGAESRDHVSDKELSTFIAELKQTLHDAEEQQGKRAHVALHSSAEGTTRTGVPTPGPRANGAPTGQARRSA